MQNFLVFSLSNVLIILSLYFKCLLLFICYLFIHVNGCHGLHVEVRGQPTGAGSLFPLCGFWGLNIGCQMWWQL